MFVGAAYACPQGDDVLPGVRRNMRRRIVHGPSCIPVAISGRLSQPDFIADRIVSSRLDPWFVHRAG